MPKPRELDRIQRWMQQAIVAVDGPPALEVRRRIRPSATMAPQERLDVYRGMYDARLTEALEADFPAVADLLGEEMFSEMCSLYIREHPSRSYTLNELGRNLPEFLMRLDGLPHPAFARDLARLEWASTEVFDEQEAPSLDPGAIAAVPAEAWPDARLIPIAAFRLLELDHASHLYVEALRSERARPPRRRNRTRLVVCRRNYGVIWFTVDGAAFQVLTRLAAGQPMAEAVARVRGQQRVFEWFQRWSTEGIFQAVVY